MNSEFSIDVVQNYHDVLRRIEESAQKANRDPSEITLVGVIKKIELERILPVVEEGLDTIGVIMGNEFMDKYSDIKSSYPKTAIHVIGKMQSNKVKDSVEYCDLIQSVKRKKILNYINKRARRNNKIFPIFLQVDFSTVDNLKGWTLEETLHYIEKKDSWPNVQIQGLMTIAPLEYMSDHSLLAKFYSKTRRIFDEEIVPRLDYDNPQLSMGMSDAFELAIEKGSTMVRVGTAIFGPRNN